MKQVIKIKSEMTDLQVEISTGKDLKRAQIKRLKTRYQFLQLCVSYLQTEPSVDYIKKEKERLQNKINLINAGYFPDKRLIEAGLRREEQKEHKQYNKIMSLDKFKAQLKAINYLLS